MTNAVDLSTVGSPVAPCFHPNAFSGKKALVVGVANHRSLAWAAAQALRAGGAEVGFSYQEALEKRVLPLAEELGTTFAVPCDLTREADVTRLFETVAQKWGEVHFVIHAVAFAPKKDLEGRFLEVSQEGFQTALTISAYTLVALARAASPYLRSPAGGSIVTLSYYGAEKVVPHYHLMGVAKAALECSVRYLAYDMGAQKVRVNAISAGPVRTLASSGIKDFREMLSASAEKTPLKENISAEDVGNLTAYLCSDAARHMTGATLYVDSGTHIMGV